MLSQEIKDQLFEVLKTLQKTVTLKVDHSDHSKQNELLSLVEDIVSCGQNIKLKKMNTFSEVPRLSLSYEEKDCGIEFLGIPAGHEFSSLVLAILNVDGKGKLPDDEIISRIKNLKNPLPIKTYISLSCENCPEVVQTLNLFAAVHPHFSHQMIDGEYFQEEMKQLGLQGVPSIVVNNELLHSGKIALIDLLKLLEEKFGVLDKSIHQRPSTQEYDVAIIGGGPAGVSAAIYCARKGLKTALIAEKIGGQVQETKGIENFISIPFTEGPHLSAHLFSHLKQYPIDVLEHRRVKELNLDDDISKKKILLEDGKMIFSRSIIITTGAKWRELGVPGEKEFLGRGVAFCPHCDGPYFKGKNIAVIGGGNSGVEAAIDLSGLAQSVTLIEYASKLKADQILIDKLKSLPNISIVTEAKIKKILGDRDKVTSLVYDDLSFQVEKSLNIDGVFVQIGLVPNSHFISDKISKNQYGEILIDEKCRTNMAGVYAAGDVTNVPFKQIIIAMGEGAKAALTTFEDLMVRTS